DRRGMIALDRTRLTGRLPSVGRTGRPHVIHWIRFSGQAADCYDEWLPERVQPALGSNISRWHCDEFLTFPIDIVGPLFIVAVSGRKWEELGGLHAPGSCSAVQQK